MSTASMLEASWDIVGVNRNSNYAEARRLYLFRALHIHPDKSALADKTAAAEAFTRLKNHWDVLEAFLKDRGDIIPDDTTPSKITRFKWIYSTIHILLSLLLAIDDRRARPYNLGFGKVS
jgi:curved DNA-binding protein CbpA